MAFDSSAIEEIRQHLQFGRDLRERGDLSGAFAHFEHCLLLDPYCWPAWIDSAVVQLAFGNFADARYRYERAYTCGPPLSLVARGIADCSFQLGDVQRGLVAMATALLITPDDPVTWYELSALAWSNGDTSDAIHCINRCIILSPDHPSPYFRRGAYLQTLRLIPQAIWSFEACLRLDPNYPNALQRLNICFTLT